MKHLLLIIAACALAIGASTGYGAPRDAKELVRDVRTLTHSEETKRPLVRTDYDRLIALIPEVFALVRTPDDLWRRIPSDEFPNQPGIMVFDVLWYALRIAAGSAPSDAEKERWLRQEVELTKQMLRAPRTLRVYAEKRDAGNDASDYNVVLTIPSMVLASAKSLLKRHGFLKPDEWTVVYGITVIDDPGAVVVRDGKPFLSPRTLALLGLPGAGSRPVSVEELVRRRIVDAEVKENSQIIELRPVSRALPR